MTDTGLTGIFARPTSVILCGNSRPLLNWVAYAMTAGNPGGFLWTDIQLEGEVRDQPDLLLMDRIPPNRFFEISPEDLHLDEFSGNVALGGLVRSGEPSDAVRRFADFLRLPAHIRSMVSLASPTGPSTTFVVSNGQRVAGIYSWRTSAPALRAIVEAGVSLLLTWAEAPTKGRLQFDYVLHLKGTEPAAWRDAVLRVEKGAPDGLLRTGAELRLRDDPDVATVLDKAL